MLTHTSKMKKCVIVALSILSLTLLFSLSYFYPTSISTTISPTRSPRVLRRRPVRVTSTRVPVSSASLSFLFSHNHTLYPHLVLWAHMRDLLSRPDTLPDVSDGTREASIAFKSLLATLSMEKDGAFNNDSLPDNKSCPLSVQGNSSRVEIPCGLVEDSAITLVGVPIGKNGSSRFGIELIGSDLGTKEVSKTERPIVLSWNVSLDPKQPVIYQNFWLPGNGWGELDFCPSTRSISIDESAVDGFLRCNQQPTESSITQDSVNGSENISNEQSRRVTRLSHLTSGFPFVEGHPFTATLWNGVEGFHMTVNGRHETSYRYRERLEPWSVTEVRVLGDLGLLSVIVNGLPASEDLDFVADLELLKAPKFDTKKEIFLLVGVFSTANNFKRRMAIRKSWMQYEAVRSGDVVVRFFAGLHKNDNVNLELWREAELYEDIQIMPFVDYYSLITLKAVAICTYATKIAGAKYIMKTDDDAFVRIDEIISILSKSSSKALLYGLISFQSSPHRDEDSKWFVSPEEWWNASYPPWAHGPGYIISRDIAEFVVQGHAERYLQLFKLEDVAMGIWIDEYKNTGQEINYVTDDRFYNEGCESDYILAHYQSPRLLLCLWTKLQRDHRAFCCE